MTDVIAAALKDICPQDNMMTDTLYSTSRLMRVISLPIQKIDIFLNGCMLFWKDAKNLKICSNYVAHK